MGEMVWVGTTSVGCVRTVRFVSESETWKEGDAVPTSHAKVHQHPAPRSVLTDGLREYETPS